MAELKEMDVGFGGLSYFEWNCGHRLHQNEPCPLCTNRDEKRSNPLAHLTPEQVNALKQTALVWDSIIGWLDQPGIPRMEE